MGRGWGGDGERGGERGWVKGGKGRRNEMKAEEREEKNELGDLMVPGRKFAVCLE